jgi:hypothetical protein
LSHTQLHCKLNSMFNEQPCLHPSWINAWFNTPIYLKNSRIVEKSFCWSWQWQWKIQFQFQL